MSKLLPIIGGLTAGTAVIGGTATYFLTKENPKPFKEQFSHSLIAMDESRTTLFKEKLKKLKDSDKEPNNAKLKAAKAEAKAQSNSDVAGLDNLKKGCQEIYDSGFIDRNSVIFKDFETYCSKNIKDQITATKWALGASDFAWAPKLEALKDPNKVLIDSLRQVANKSGGAKEVDLKGWCQSVENTLFEGSENITFKNANDFCKKD